MHPLSVHQVVIFFVLFHVRNCERRIEKGTIVLQPKRYVVYLAESQVSPMDYDSWLCGGALVSTEYIITSAACVEDVKHLYAIAGYSKYVSGSEIYTNPCTSRKKKKIVFSCVPKSYEFNYEHLNKWAYIDIAIVKVESPYDLYDKEFESFCSYIPKPIQVNYENKYQESEIDAIVLGWGHKKKWRMPNDTTNYNQKDLQYTSIIIADKEECKRHYLVYTNMSYVIDKYMICSIESGNIDSEGMLIQRSSPNAEGCTTKTQKLLGFEGLSCEESVEAGNFILLDNRKSSNLRENDTIEKVAENITKQENKSKNITNNTPRLEDMNMRRNGICQNDHGGPVVTWVGASEVLIAVASVFKVSKDRQCIGPFLYTSTQCNGAFLDCLLSSDSNKTAAARRIFCDSSPEEKGFDTVERYISWKDHADGPSDNERW